MTMNILHISDIHFRRRYEPCDDGYKGMLFCMQSPLIPLNSCIKKVQKKDKIDLLLISGDLTEDGDPEDYAYLKDHLKRLMGETKMIVTLGNHDNKANFRKGWLKEKEDGGFYNQVFHLKDVSVISFDSSLQGEPDGTVGEKQLAWLKKALEEIKNRPVILLTHHHLLKNQSTTSPVPQAEKLLKVIKEQKLLCILNGHTHHPYVGTAGGSRYFTAGSLSFCGESEENGAVRFEEKYGYNLYRINEGEITEEVFTFTTNKIIKTVFMR
ncbi:metallophosphoesterase family protein [Lacrimispora sp. JR3]|uniref:metallophosphoesterase family protein n=1 Tax=Lacrimispora sinapis TaxID=3111456 RepID=UPI00374A520C